ncbi:SDR family oxidoreductase [Pseudonocardia sp. GCM10023141]|uniref:SDR family oxidoreductase n=1 Tax=Pseudonocardia sp. GCM10023141 TaxID=3252653 RepID=UPI0036218C3F
MSDTVLVAGATGMLGRQVAQLLLDGGHRVKTLSRDPSRAQALRGVADEIVLGDATRPETLHGVLDGVDAVVSCLGAPMAFSTGDRRSFHDLDTVANLNLVDAARRSGVRRFVYVSLLLGSAWSGTAYVRAHEDVVSALGGSGMSHGIVRPTGMFPIFDPFLTMARRGIAWIPGDGTARTNPVHPHEVAQACVDVLGRPGDVDVPVGGPEILTREEIVRLAFAAVGRRPRILHLPPRALLAGSALLGQVHPRLSEVTDFAARALTSDFLAPLGGTRRLAEHFTATVRAAQPVLRS